jgi:hypothetical protein
MLSGQRYQFVQGYAQQGLPTPNDLDSVNMNSFMVTGNSGDRNPAGDQLYVFFAVHGDYSGDLTDKANYNYFIEHHADTEGELWWRTTADRGWGIALVADADDRNPAIAKTFKRYDQYPILDEEAEGKLEQEQHVENWDEWGRRDFKEKLFPTYDDDGEYREETAVDRSFQELSKEEEKAFLDALSYTLMERTGQYPEHESGTVSSSIFPYEKWVAAIHNEAELLVMLDYFREHGKLKGFAGWTAAVEV